MKKIACRKDLTTLTDAQRDSLVDAFLQLKADGKYDKYADQHDDYFGDAHGNPFFYPWHREFLANLEKELQAYDPDIALPYWDSTKDQSTATLPWTDDFMGGTGNPVSGPFNPWGIARALGVSGSLPSAAAIDDDRDETPYEDHWPPAESAHGSPHVWVGGNMVTARSPEDPVFFLHHCFVDKWWSDWQHAHPAEDEYQGSGARSPGSAMPPWATTPNDVIDSLALDYIYDTDPARVSTNTTELKFIDIPEGEITVRGVTFDVVTCQSLSFNVTAGPGADFDTPFGTSISVDPGDGAVAGEAILWISYQGTNDGDTATGSVTIECPQTGDEWTIPITANTIARPTVGVALVLDKSGSMETDIGDGRTRNQLLVSAANVFANVIQDENGLGIAAFDHDAVKVMDIEEAGPPLSEMAFGTGRAAAVGHIGAHTPNPNGFTSIGDGVIEGDALMTAAASDFDETAMIVFTDGKENRAEYIADVDHLIGDRVFAIGLGTASDLNAAALAELCNNTGGELLLTDTIDPVDDEYKLAKYYLQVLAGITNVDIVTDPEDYIKPGDTHRIEFDLNETDVSHDVVLLSEAANVVRMVLETPQGDIIDPAFASGAIGVRYVPGPNFSYYRVSLPVVGPGGDAAREGTWAAILTVDDRHWKKWLAGQFDPDVHVDGLPSALIHGARYNLSVYALSNLRLRALLRQNSYEPGADLTIRAVLTEYGLPPAGNADTVAHLTRPDGTNAAVSMNEVEPGVFEATVPATLNGVYTARVIATGTTARHRPFTREHTVTGAVWRGGDDPWPTSDDDRDGDRGKDAACLCELFRCLLHPEHGRLHEVAKEWGLDLDYVRRCLARWCKCKGVTPRATIQPTAVAADLADLIRNEPKLGSAITAIVSALRDGT